MRLLVHWHIYYPEQIPWFIGKLRSICDIDWDLYVTGLEDAMPQVRAFKPDAVYLDVDKTGYDVWPFIAVLKAVDLGLYTHVLKIHTKNRSPKLLQLNGVALPGYRWRNLLVNALLGSPAKFRRALEASGRGLACQDVLVKNLSRTNPTDNEMLLAEAARLGISLKGRQFAAGTMFIARMEPYAVFRDAPLNASMFESQAGTHFSGSPAHVYERLLSLVVTSAGYEIVPLVTNPIASLWKRIVVR